MSKIAPAPCVDHLPKRGVKLRWTLLIALALLAPRAVDAAWASPAPPSQAAAAIGSEKGVLGVRCTSGPIRDHAPTYLCVVRVRNGCVAALFQYRHGQIGFYRSSARQVRCWRSEGGPTS